MNIRFLVQLTNLNKNMFISNRYSLDFIMICVSISVFCVSVSDWLNLTEIFIFDFD